MPIEGDAPTEPGGNGVAELLSVVIPAHNERGHIAATVRELTATLRESGIGYEVLIVNDSSTDDTESVLCELCSEDAGVRYLNNTPPNGFGYAVRRGLAEFRGDAVAIMMADGSDDPSDLVVFYRKLQDGYDCVFGSRFMRSSTIVDYPLPKLLLNRAANILLQCLFFMRYNDTTNAFKLYRRETIAGLQPLLSCHFNLTVELPLKAIVRGYRYTVTPNSWKNRTSGISKFRIREMGSRYLFIVVYCLIEHMLSRGDYRVARTMENNPGKRLSVTQKHTV